MNGRMPAEAVIELPASTRNATRVIRNCEWKLQTFLERDAYAEYDVAQAYDPPADDRLEARHRIAINSAMRARSSVAAWAPFLDRPIPELAAVPRDLCLVRGAEADVARGIAAVATVVGQIGSARWLTDMAATKMLYMLRPGFVAISDSYVRSALGLDNREAPGPGPGRAWFVCHRFTRVMRAMRELGRANEPALAQLEAFVAGLGTIKVARDSQDSTRRWIGRELPARLSPVRILDVLLWTEGAIHGVAPDPKWSVWAAEGHEGSGGAVR